VNNVFTLGGRNLEVVEYYAGGDQFDAVVDRAVWLDTGEELTDEDYDAFYRVYPQWAALIQYGDF
jgi:hypothetical protein